MPIWRGIRKRQIWIQIIKKQCMRGPFNTTEAFKRSYPDASALIKIRLFPVFNKANTDTRQKIQLNWHGMPVMTNRWRLTAYR